MSDVHPGRLPPGAALDLDAIEARLLQTGMASRQRSLLIDAPALIAEVKRLRAALDAQPPHPEEPPQNRRAEEWRGEYAAQPPQAPQKEPERSGEIVCPHCRAPLYRIVKAKPRPFHFDPEDND